MQKIVIAVLIVCGCFVFSPVKSQILRVDSISEIQKKRGLLFRYISSSDLEGLVELDLFRNKKYSYRVESTNYTRNSTGNWKLENGILCLNSSLIDTAIRIKVKYVKQENPDIGNSPFLIPMNFQGKTFPNSVVQFKNSNDYCFPFFDTCTGRVSVNNLVRVDFGVGVKSSWNKVNVVNGKKIIFVAQTNIDLDAYLFFRNRKYKVLSSGIELVK